MTINEAEQIGRYRILKRIGAGGMGEVFLAEDTNLERTVALKLLPKDSDAQSTRRFMQEAKVASQLSHPNVCVIHEVGETKDGLPFIAMEYVEGQPLSSKIANRPLDALTVTHIGAQIADALEEAHRKGIIHRDIKSANIMINPRGQAKVLDFGLAKMNPAFVVSSDSQAPTQAKTNPNLVLGTVQYMSPEQSLGQEVDARSDLFSLGVVLYEMATGQLPFNGASITETIDKIVHSQPEAIARYNYEVPAELERIIKKALRKDKDERYQTARDLFVDLRNLEKELELQTRLGSAEFAVSGGVENQSVNYPSNQSVSGRSYKTANIDATPTMSSAEYLVREIKRHRVASVLIGAAVLVLIVGASFYVYSRFLNRRPIPITKLEAARFTAIGKALDAAISPNGEYVTYVVESGGKQSLWIKHVSTGSTTQIIQPAEVIYQGLDFSNDGHYIFYNLWDKKSVGMIYKVPILGGTSELVVKDVMPSLKVSPDGKQIGFFRGYASENKTGLLVANIDGTNERVVRKSTTEDSWLMSVTWSYAGKSLTCAVGTSDKQGVPYYQLMELPIDGSEMKPIMPERKRGWINGLTWLSDGSGLLVVHGTQSQLPTQIWFIEYPSGEARQLTNDVNGYRNISATADGSTIVSIQTDVTSNVWVSQTSDLTKAKKITSAKYNGLQVTWTPDNRIVYVSGESGNLDIWIMDADGMNQKQLTTDTAEDLEPVVVEDGKTIVFFSGRGGLPRLWRMNIDGSEQKPIEGNENRFGLSGSLKGNEIVYLARLNDRVVLHSLPLNGGKSTPLTDRWTYQPSVSPDGKSVVYSFWDDKANPQKLSYEVLSLEDKKTVKSFSIPSTAIVEAGELFFRWTSDSKALTFIDRQGGVGNIWSLTLDGKPPKKLTNFNENTIFSFAWSPDGKYFAAGRGVQASDVVLLKDVKQN